MTALHRAKTLHSFYKVIQIGARAPCNVFDEVRGCLRLEDCPFRMRLDPSQDGHAIFAAPPEIDLPVEASDTCFRSVDFTGTHDRCERVGGRRANRGLQSFGRMRLKTARQKKQNAERQRQQERAEIGGFGDPGRKLGEMKQGPREPTLAIDTLCCAPRGGFGFIACRGCAITYPVASLKQAVGAPPALGLEGTVDPKANQDQVLHLDVVVIGDSSSLKQIEKMDASTWFGAKGQGIFLGQKGARVEFHSWEFAPGQTFHVRLVTGADAKAVLAFADYSTPGPHRIALAKAGAQMLKLGSAGLRTLDRKVSAQSEPPDPEMRSVCNDN